MIRRTLVAATWLIAASAEAEDSFPQVSPPFGSAPQVGAARVSLTTMAAESETGDRLDGASMIEAAIGLPYFAGLRAALPIVSGEGLDAGSPLVTLTGYMSLGLSTSLKLECLAEMGVRTPSLGASDLVLGEEQIAYSGWGQRGGVFLNLVHQSGLSLTSFFKREPSFSRWGAGLGYRLFAGGQVTLGIGLASSFDRTRVPSKILAHLTYRPRWLADASASLFGNYSIDGDDAVLAGAEATTIGLALTWDFALGTDRASPGRRLLTASSSEPRDNLTRLEIDDAPISLSELAVPSTVTIFAFEAWWCSPCRDVHRELEKLASSRPDLQIRLIDADANKRVFAANGGTALPLVIVYGRDGREVGRVSGYKPLAFDQLIEKASK